MKVLLANPRGFCAGVDRAIEIVERSLRQYGAPVYVRHEVVHNRFVVDRLKQLGAIFVDELSEVPEGSTVIFSAHGVSQAVQQEAQTKKLTVLDATCPLVTKVHHEVARYSRKGYTCILIGHAGHPEVEGTMGQVEMPGRMVLVEEVEDVKKLSFSEDEKLVYMTQTTLSVDDTARVINALRDQFPQVECPKKEDICYATTNRQSAVKQLAAQCDIVLVVGSENSSNSNRLRELAERLGCSAHLVDGKQELQRDWFVDQQIVGVTAGASAPEVLVQDVVQQLRDWGATDVSELAGEVETIDFGLPRELRH